MLPNRLVFMEVLHATMLREVSYCVAITSQDPLGGEKPVQTHRAPGMDPRCANTDLCS